MVSQSSRQAGCAIHHETSRTRHAQPHHTNCTLSHPGVTSPAWSWCDLRAASRIAQSLPTCPCLPSPACVYKATSQQGAYSTTPFRLSGIAGTDLVWVWPSLRGSGRCAPVAHARVPFTLRDRTWLCLTSASAAHLREKIAVGQHVNWRLELIDPCGARPPKSGRSPPTTLDEDLGWIIAHAHVVRSLLAETFSGW